MENLLEQLYYGNIAPVDQPTRRSDDPVLLEQLCELEQQFLQGCTPTQTALFEQYQTVQSKLSLHNSAQAFSCGFSLGVRLLLQAQAG